MMTIPSDQWFVIERDFDHQPDRFELADTAVSDIIKLRKQLDRDHPESHVTWFIGEVEKKMQKIQQECDKQEGRPYDAFDTMLRAAGPRTADFLQCFNIKLNAEAYPTILANRRFQYASYGTKIAHGPLKILCERNPGKVTRKFLEDLAPSDFKRARPLFQLPSEPIKLKEFEFHYIFLDRIVNAFGPFLDDEDEATEEEEEDDDSELFVTFNDVAAKETIQLDRLWKMLDGFLEVENDQYIFESITAQALLMRSEAATFKQFCLNLFISSLALGCLFVITAFYNLEDTSSLECFHVSGDFGMVDASECWIIYICFWSLQICSLIELGLTIIDIYFWGWGWVSFWNVFDLFLECQSLVFISFLLTGKQFGTLPVWIMPIVIATRWIKWGLFVLLMPTIGIHALPALLAVFSVPSFTLFSLIIFVCIGSTHAYLGFRIHENGKTFLQFGPWGLFQSFFRMARSILFAEGDMDHLAGRISWIATENITGNNQTVIDSAESGDWGAVGEVFSIYETLNFFMLCLLLFGVTIMNTYVGVLSEKYFEYYAHKFHYFHSYKAQWQIKAIARRKFWSRLMCLQRVVRLKPIESYPSRQGLHQHQKYGLWIVSHPQEVNDLKHLDHRLVEVEQILRGLKAAGPHSGMTQSVQL